MDLGNLSPKSIDVLTSSGLQDQTNQKDIVKDIERNQAEFKELFPQKKQADNKKRNVGMGALVASNRAASTLARMTPCTYSKANSQSTTSRTGRIKSAVSRPQYSTKRTTAMTSAHEMMTGL